MFGIPVRIHWSWVLTIFLLTWSMEAIYLPGVYADWTSQQRWSAGLLVSLLFLGSVLARELMQARVARRRGYPVPVVALYFFGSATTTSQEPRTARDEFWIALIGPVTSLGIAALLGSAWAAGQAADSTPLYAVAGYVAITNLALGVFNLLPGFPLDGGRVLRSLLWGTGRSFTEATRLAAIAGRIVAGVLVLGGVTIVIAGGWLGGLWLMFIGWFLWSSAEMNFQQVLVQSSLHDVPVASLVERDIPRVSPDVTLEQLAREHVLGRNQQIFFVAPAEEGEVLGMITLKDLHRTPRASWPFTSVYRAMTPRDKLVATGVQTSALDAARTMAEQRLDELPVFNGREPVGVLTRSALARAIQVQRAIQPRRTGA